MARDPERLARFRREAKSLEGQALDRDLQDIECPAHQRGDVFRSTQ
jgi:hypothetical protein